MSIWNTPPAQTDVAIVGGGLIGTSIAYHLAERGIECCLFEKNLLASGASGRNDGQVILETVDYYPRMKEIYGDKGAFDILDFKRLGQKALHDFIEPFSARERLAYHRDGSLTLAFNDVEAQKIEDATREMIRDGFAMELIDQREIEKLIQTSRFKMGKMDRSDATVNPAELTRTIAKEAFDKGTHFFEHCPVTLENDNRLTHHFGETSAEIIILATNANSPLVLDKFKDLVFPTRGQVLATESSDIRIPGFGCITNFGYDYWHWTDDGRLVLGGKRIADEHGEVGYDDYVNPIVQSALEAFFKEMYPQYKHLKIARRWSGIMGFSRDGIPITGPLGGDRRLWATVGFTGYGLGMCWSIGEAVAQVLNDEPSRLTEILSMFSPSRFE